MRRHRVALLAGLLGLAACGGAAPARDSGAADQPMDGMPGMGAMEGMAAGDTTAGAFWDAVRQHLDSVVWLEPNRLVFVRAEHDSLVRLALERIDRDMAGMNMPADGAWQALADSVRRDLTALPALEGEPFVLRMRAHGGRLRRLISMHLRMMDRMPM